MSVMLPHKKSTAVIVGLLLIDLPVFLAVLVVGWFYGFQHTYWAVSDWRMQHPWSLIPSFLLLVWLIRKWWKAR